MVGVLEKPLVSGRIDTDMFVLEALPFSQSNGLIKNLLNIRACIKVSHWKVWLFQFGMHLQTRLSFNGFIFYKFIFTKMQRKTCRFQICPISIELLLDLIDPPSPNLLCYIATAIDKIPKDQILKSLFFSFSILIFFVHISWFFLPLSPSSFSILYLFLSNYPSLYFFFFS